MAMPLVDCEKSPAEWAALLECASPHADSFRLHELLRGVHWPTMLALAEEHGVIAQVARNVTGLRAEAVPREITERILELERMQIASALKMLAELYRVLENFRAAGLETALCKGMVLAMRAYGDPAARHYGDLDFLVRHGDIGRASASMIAAGYEAEIPLEAIAAGKIPGQYLFVRTKSPLLVELHTERTMRYFPRPLPIDKFFERRTAVTIDGHDIPALAPGDELILICIHGAKHLWERLAMVADVAAYVTRQKELNWEQIFETARNTGAERMLHLGLLLARNMLGANLPGAVTATIDKDSEGRKLAKQISSWLSSPGQIQPNLLARARFRMQMRGGLLRGSEYLLRLIFSPTQEDWGSPSAKRIFGGVLGPLRRPFRLAKKYGQDKSK
jgi:hypothetical protein